MTQILMSCISKRYSTFAYTHLSVFYLYFKFL
jgi:hypothetical protein